MLTAQVPPSRGGATPSTPSVREVERKLAQVNVEDGDHDENCRFFVYCKKCKGMTKGKLRVRCVECRDPAFVLSTVSPSSPLPPSLPLSSLSLSLSLSLIYHDSSSTGAPGLGRCTSSTKAARTL